MIMLILFSVLNHVFSLWKKASKIKIKQNHQILAVSAMTLSFVEVGQQDRLVSELFWFITVIFVATNKYL